MFLSSCMAVSIIIALEGEQSEAALFEVTCSSTFYSKSSTSSSHSFTTTAMMAPDTFDEILGLEERFYDDGFQQGLADGVKAGQIEGRTFGLEKGFEKYVESGKLYGKSLIWANRMPGSPDSPKLRDSRSELLSPPKVGANDQQTSSRRTLPSLPHNQRLSKHLKVLHALSESESMSTENTEEAVSDFDDRLKRAQGKAKIIERMIGEGRGDVLNDGQMEDGNISGIEETSGSSIRN